MHFLICIYCYMNISEILDQLVFLEVITERMDN